MNDHIASLSVLLQSAMLVALLLAGLFLGEWRERDFRLSFSIRTLLLAMTYIAVLFWAVTWVVKSYMRTH